MKCAILFSGVYKNATEPIVELLEWLRNHEGYEVDAYIHAWWDESYVGKRYRYEHLSIVEKDPTQEIEEKIKPVKFKLEPQAAMNFTGLPLKDEPDSSPLLREVGYFSVLSQMESLKRCYKLIDTPTQYDFIMRLRGDLFIEDKTYRIPFEKKDLLENRVYISDGQFFTGWPFGDWAYMARPEIMEAFIMNQEEIWRYIGKTLGYIPHIHNYFPKMFQMIGVEPVRWGIPLKITRLSPGHTNHLMMDTDEKPGKFPFFWHLMDPERLKY